MKLQSLPKAQRTQGLDALVKEIAFKSYQKLGKIQLHNLDQTSAQKLNQTRLDQNSASKS